ncbi:hypothetical protein ABZ835_30160 [Streptomyces sp. NPDC047461]|uniref:hypothetical protein n=1 Tax=Streptomyces sp. NPDC047461 TaxID=3155619 RepID=UPI0033D5F1FA
MGAGFLIVPLWIYLMIAVPFCALVGSRSSSRAGRLMAVALVFVPLSLVIGLIPA